MQTCGTSTAVIESPIDRQKCTAEIFVVKGDRYSLLGKATAENLGLLHVGPEPACTISAVDV